MKKTELKLKLWGTVTGQTSETYAVIEDTKLRKQTLYRVNDTIQNAVVKEIHREKIILDVDGTYEVLEMEKISRRIFIIFSQSIVTQGKQQSNPDEYHVET